MEHRGPGSSATVGVESIPDVALRRAEPLDARPISEDAPVRTVFLFAVIVPLAIAIAVPSAMRQSELTDGTTAEETESHPLPEQEPHVFANGVVEGQDREVPLRFEVTGRLLSLEVDEGDSVHKGEVIARLDPSAWQVELAKAKARLLQMKAEYELLLAGERQEAKEFARAEVRRAKAEAISSQKNYQRLSRLIERSVITAQEFDEGKAALSANQAAYEAALAKCKEAEAEPRMEEVKIAEAKITLEETQVRFAETMLAKTELTAPSDGVVLQRRGEPGELVGPDSEEPIVVLADTSSVHVRAFVEELDAMHVAPGNPAYVEADGMPGVRFKGEVVRCAPYMVAKLHFSNKPTERVDVKVREVVLKLDSRGDVDCLLVGLPVDVYIERNSARTSEAAD